MRSVLPGPVRRWLRRCLLELPVRARDLGGDVSDALRLRGDSPPLPPPRLRRGVSCTCSRQEFLDVGRWAAEELKVVVATATGTADTTVGRWLDFGCGCGRVALHLAGVPGLEVWGVDVDAPAVTWARRHLGRERFQVIDAEPPTPLADDFFDVAYAISVFTHLDEAAQDRWLEEMTRVLKPGGVLVATTHNESLVYSRPDLPEASKQELAARGFIFAPGGGPFNENSTFHTREYLESSWGRHFEPVLYRRQSLGGFQDMSAWRKRIVEG